MLYRGECLETYNKSQGRLIPSGDQIEIVTLMNGSFRMDGKITMGPSESNTVRAQHVSNGLLGGCFVSTSRSYEVAKRFATSDNTSEGVIYCIDEELCAVHGVVLRELPDPAEPQEREVSIRAIDGGVIPSEIVVRIDMVSPR